MHNNDAILFEAEQSGGWFHAKKASPIWAKKLLASEQIQTLEGLETVPAGSFLCRGEAGDYWPQKEASLLKRYEPAGDAGADGWQQFLPRPDAEGVWAIQIDHPFSVRAAWGELAGKPGDYLVKNFADRNEPSPKDVWIVDQTLFAATYVRVADKDESTP